MLRPYPGRYLPEDRQSFNYRLSRAHRVIENDFGTMATKFLIFRRSIIAAPEKVTKITKAITCLHNYLKISEASSNVSSRQYCPPGYADHEDRDGNLVPGDWRNVAADGLRGIHRTGSNSYSQTAAHLRDTMRDYFTSPTRSVPW